MNRKEILLILAAVLFVFIAQGVSEAADPKMYWTQGRKILRGNPGDTNVETLVTGRNPSNLALDVAGNRMYWIDHAYNSIFKATLDGKQQSQTRKSIGQIQATRKSPEQILMDQAC